MSEDARKKALDTFLGLVAERGYGEVSLADVSMASGLSRAELYRLYPDKLALVAGFMARIDGEVLAATPEAEDPEETVRDRLFDILMRRFDALKPHRVALASIRRAGLRDPLTALVLGPTLMRSMAAMLEAAGADSSGILGAVRQNGLLAIYAAVSQVFERDDTGDLSQTMAALDSRLKTAEKWAQTFDKHRVSPRSPAESAPAA
ncbi:MAG: TetR family transcriptional regulator [Proteobacteria bacterium]|nr:TetR family transcriptional regulator [Pseudomonadota bacterium]